MKKAISLIACFMVLTNMSAQEKHHIHLKLIQPGIEYQLELRNSLLASIDLGFGFTNLSYNSEDDFNAYLSTFSNITLKNIYNHTKLMSRNNKLSSHSGNYYGLRCLGYGNNVNNSSKSQSFNYAIGPVWGAQRYYNSFYYQIEIGLGYHNGYEINDFAPLARFCIGINLKQW